MTLTSRFLLMPSPPVSTRSIARGTCRRVYVRSRLYFPETETGNSEQIRLLPVRVLDEILCSGILCGCVVPSTYSFPAEQRNLTKRLDDVPTRENRSGTRRYTKAPMMTMSCAQIPQGLSMIAGIASCVAYSMMTRTPLLSLEVLGANRSPWYLASFSVVSNRFIHGTTRSTRAEMER